MLFFIFRLFFFKLTFLNLKLKFGTYPLMLMAHKFDTLHFVILLPDRLLDSCQIWYTRCQDAADVELQMEFFIYVLPHKEDMTLRFSVHRLR